MKITQRQPKVRGAPSDRAAVVAIGRAADGDPLRDRARLAGDDVVHRERDPRRLGAPHDDARDRVGSAQGFEAAEAEPSAFVLVVDRREAKLIGESERATSGVGA